VGGAGDHHAIPEPQELWARHSGLGSGQFPLEWLKAGELPSPERETALFLLFSCWGETAPHDALAFTDSMGGSGVLRELVVRSWASGDPGAVAACLQRSPETLGMMSGQFAAGGGEDSLIWWIGKEWAKQGPEEALEWARGMEGEASTLAVGAIFRHLAARDPAAAAESASGMSGELHASASRSVAREWGKLDFAEAEKWVDSLPGDQRDDVMAEAVRGLAENAPEDAVRQLEGIGDDRVFGDVFQQVMAKLTQADPVAARELALAQPDGSIRDAAVSIFAYQDTNMSAPERLALAEQIGDGEIRQRTVAGAVMKWLGSDPAAALDYVRTSESLDPGTKQMILEGAAAGH
jgi:hypothetical protein